MANSVVLITGSSRGLGKSIAYKMASRGYDVIINYNNSADAANKIVEDIIKKYNVRAISIKCDVSSKEEVENMYKYIINEFGRIDILVNNAGIANDTIFDDKTKESFEKIMSVNLIGTFLTSKYFGKYMYDKKNGIIINIASTAGIDNNYPESCDYDASKAGVISLTHNLAKQFAPYVRVNAICPGWINTEMNKNMDSDYKKDIEKQIYLGRFAEPDEIASVVSFLTSEDAKYINDSIIRVDGGEHD